MSRLQDVKYSRRRLRFSQNYQTIDGLLKLMNNVCGWLSVSKAVEALAGLKPSVTFVRILWKSKPPAIESNAASRDIKHS